MYFDDCPIQTSLSKRCSHGLYSFFHSNVHSRGFSPSVPMIFLLKPPLVVSIPLKKYELVNWDDDIPNISGKKSKVMFQENHQLIVHISLRKNAMDFATKKSSNRLRCRLRWDPRPCTPARDTGSASGQQRPHPVATDDMAITTW